MRPAHACDEPLGPFHTILVASDLTPQSKRGFRLALSIARTHRAKMILVTVRNHPKPRTMLFVSSNHIANPHLSERLEVRAKKRFDDYLRGEELEGIELERYYREGAPAEEILTLAEEVDADLIVVGGSRVDTKAGHILQHLMFESVAAMVRRKADRPVLTVR